MNVFHLAIERFEKAGKSRRIADVRAEARGVLADQIQLNRAIGGKLFCFEKDLFDRLGAHQPADRRDRAERTALVAAFGNS